MWYIFLSNMRWRLIMVNLDLSINICMLVDIEHFYRVRTVYMCNALTCHDVIHQLNAGFYLFFKIFIPSKF